MLQLKNHSPFSPAICLFPDEHGVDTLYVVVKATFTMGSEIQIAEEQKPPQQEDEYWGEPGLSSIRYMSEMHLSKPSTDIIVNGHAYAPYNKPVNQIDCGVKVGNYRKTARVFGDRYWENMKISYPKPFLKMPLVYENAYGGTCLQTKKENGKEVKERLMHTVNPVGRGFRKMGTEAINADKLPNVEDPNKLISTPLDKPAPVGFGFISPTWLPRKQFAGTYDEAWQKTRAPYLPKDFDNRFFNAAPKELTCNGYLRGGESVMLVNFTLGEPVQFTLPICQLNCEINIAGRTETPDFNLETVLFEPDDMLFTMTWRTQLNCDKQALKVNEIHVHSSWNGISQAVA
jgi:hypothetical protein